MRIAIDGPSAAGKSTIAKQLAKKLEITYIDTGAMYRAVALKVLRMGGRPDRESDALEALKGLDLTVGHSEGCQLVFLDGEDVTGLIRTPEMAKGASDVSAFRDVRNKLVELQRRIAKGFDVVMDGRDIGTYVFPDAEFKFYLTASVEERARRRFDELKAGVGGPGGSGSEVGGSEVGGSGGSGSGVGGPGGSGSKVGGPGGGGLTYEKCLVDIETRDRNDSNREFAPLKKADDAILINSTNMQSHEVVALIMGIIGDKK